VIAVVIGVGEGPIERDRSVLVASVKLVVATAPDDPVAVTV
jgi:hypothetical protein